MTDFLFARPTLIDGIMCIVDLFGIAPEYNSSSDELTADRRAFNADVESLRSDFDTAYSKVKAAYAQQSFPDCSARQAGCTADAH